MHKSAEYSNDGPSELLGAKCPSQHLKCFDESARDFVNLRAICQPTAYTRWPVVMTHMAEIERFKVITRNVEHWDLSPEDLLPLTNNRLGIFPVSQERVRL